MKLYDSRLSSYLDDFELDRRRRNRFRKWSFRGMEVLLFPDVFPSDSPYTLTTISVLKALARENAAAPLEQYARIVDVGTGNGTVAVQLSRLAPTAQIVALDNDVRALAAARFNVRMASASNVTVVGGDLLGALGTELQVAVATLPFIQELRGAGLLRRFWVEARAHMRPGALVYFSWAQWVNFRALEQAATNERFAVLRWHEFRRRGLPYSWRVYVFRAL